MLAPAWWHSSGWVHTNMPPMPLGMAKPEKVTTKVPGVLVATGGINYDEVVLLFLEKLHAWRRESLDILEFRDPGEW